MGRKALVGRKGRAQVYLVLLIEIVPRSRLYVAQTYRARGVDQDVDLPDVGSNSRGEPPDPFIGPEISRVHQDLPCARPDLRRDVRQPPSVPAAQAETHTLARKHAGGRPADAARRASHHSNIRKGRAHGPAPPLPPLPESEPAVSSAVRTYARSTTGTSIVRESRHRNAAPRRS